MVIVSFVIIVAIITGVWGVICCCLSKRYVATVFMVACVFGYSICMSEQTHILVFVNTHLCFLAHAHLHIHTCMARASEGCIHALLYVQMYT